ncbi:MAG: hypothetical protein UIQ67_06275 [Bacteroidales bacterium]|nr:hypothetical protein [Bacteroidales bacterium]
MIDLIGYKKRMHINGEDKDQYSVRINPKTRMDFEKLCALIAERTTLTDFEVAFVLAEVEQVVIENIEIGRGTEIGRLGSVELSVKANAVDSFEELDKNLVEKTKIIYKPSKGIKEALRNVKYKVVRQK